MEIWTCMNIGNHQIVMVKQCTYDAFLWKYWYMVGKVGRNLQILRGDKSQPLIWLRYLWDEARSFEPKQQILSKLRWFPFDQPHFFPESSRISQK